jgi:hypothetical protein
MLDEADDSLKEPARFLQYLAQPEPVPNWRCQIGVRLFPQTCGVGGVFYKGKGALRKNGKTEKPLALSPKN